MHAVPSIEEMVDTARCLGLSLEPDEAVLLHGYLAEKLAEMDEFAQSRLDEGAPEVTFPERGRGYRPSAAEDPLNAWTWKCEIPGAQAGLLAGKTVSYKDHTAVAGMPLAYGAAPLEGFIPQIDATIVTRVLAAGGTITGKHVMDGLAGGFGLGTQGDFGRPLNPHDTAHYTGGSSSGSAVALATGEVDISFGGDQGGSIRIPAAWCGVVGLKPTFGLVSHFGIGFGSDPSIDYTGPMAKRVEDVALALQATAGYDGLDPRQTRDIPETFDALTGLDGGVKGLRIGILEEGFEGPLQRGGALAAGFVADQRIVRQVFQFQRPAQAGEAMPRRDQHHQLPLASVWGAGTMSSRSAMIDWRLPSSSVASCSALRLTPPSRSRSSLSRSTRAST